MKLFNSAALLLFCLILPASAAPPARIISAMPSITEMLFALDLGDRVVGVTTNCNYPPAAREKEKVGGFFLNLEKVVSLKPDLIIMLEDAQRREIEKFKVYGLMVYTIDPRTVEGVMESLIAIGRITGKEATAQKVVDALRVKIKRAGEKIRRPGPRVAVMVGNNPLIVAGGGNFIDDIIKYAGGENIARGARAAYPQYSPERLLKENPECIIIPQGVLTREEMEREERWRRLAAVKSGRVLFIDADLISRPGPRVAEAIGIVTNFFYGN